MPIRRGEVYFVALGPTLGREQFGHRPVVVVSNDTLNSLPLVVTVIPGTRKARAPIPYPWNVSTPAGEASFPDETVFLTFQVRSIDPSRFRDPPIGQLSQAILGRLENALAWTLAIPTATKGTP